MEFYRLYSQNNDENAVYDPKEYETFSDAEAVLRKMIVEQGKRVNIASYISAIRKGKHRNYRKIVADALKNIFLETDPLSAEKINQMKKAIEDFNFDCCLGEKEPMDDFEAYTEGGRIVIIEFNFDQKLHVEFDVNADFYYNNDGVIESYFFIQDRNGKFKVNIDYNIKIDFPKTKSNSSSIVFVYNGLIREAYYVKKAIEEDHIPPNDIPRGITPKKIKGINPNISVETIRNHIKTLKKLGIPIKLHKVSKEEKEFWETRHIRCNEGYEMDVDFLDKVPEPIDASNLGISVNPLLVLFVLKSSDKPMRQADIIAAIKEKYNVSIARTTVGRHIELLNNFGHPIKKCKDGYIFEK